MSWWPYWWDDPDKEDEDSDFPKRPVLLLPGICGSIMHIRKIGEENSERRVWVTISGADKDF